MALSVSECRYVRMCVSVCECVYTSMCECVSVCVPANMPAGVSVCAGKGGVSPMISPDAQGLGLEQVRPDEQVDLLLSSSWKVFPGPSLANASWAGLLVSTHSIT